MARKASSSVTFSLFSFQDIITAVTGIMVLIMLILALELTTRVPPTSTVQTTRELLASEQTIEELEREIAAVQVRIEAANRKVADLPSTDAGELKRRAADLEADTRRLEAETQAAAAHQADKQQQLEDQSAESRAERQATAEEARRLEKDIQETEARIAQVNKGNRIYYRSGVEGKKTWLVELTGEQLRVAPLGEARRPLSFTAITEFGRWIRQLSVDSDAFLLVVKPGAQSRLARCRELLADTARGGLGFDVGVQLVAADQEVLDPKTGAQEP